MKFLLGGYKVGNIKIYVEGIGEVEVEESITLYELAQKLYKKDYKNI